MSCQKHLEEFFSVLGKLSRNTDNNFDSMELSIAIGSSICNENGKINTFKNFLENINNFGVNIHDPNYYSYILNELSKKDYDILFVNNIEKYMITHLCKNS